ncbi:hypothetical protein N0V95_009576 [Ascochyta clinopodiicola]|nr:hypothetical protein N0V95_009576 [Ascochyta clinopodiicola]
MNLHTTPPVVTAPKMQYIANQNANQNAHQPVLSAFPPHMSQAQHPTWQLPLKGTFSDVYQDPLPYRTRSTSPKLSVTTQTQNLSARLHKPAQYTFTDGPHDVPGTAAYYKSWTFRNKLAAGTAQVPRATAQNTSGDDSTDEDYASNPLDIDKTRSLILIFSRANVHRGSARRKVDGRMQRANRRMWVMKRS